MSNRHLDHTAFLDQIFSGLKELNIDVSNYDLDHICYRVASQERYDVLRKELGRENVLLVESLVNNRPISVFLLHKTLTYKKRNINVLELPAPKSISKYEEGYEHVEFVIDESLKNFKERYANVQFDESGYDKEVNPDLRIKFQDISVKFHEQSLKKVIEKEQLNQ